MTPRKYPQKATTTASKTTARKPAQGETEKALRHLTSQMAKRGELLASGEVIAAAAAATARAVDEALRDQNPQGLRTSIISLRELLGDLQEINAASAPDHFDELLKKLAEPSTPGQ